jgi:pimeloyl-ACP methyl ester carboxylesterase
MLVGTHRLDDEMQRLHEYSLVFDAERFAAHEKFFVDDVRQWVQERFDVALPAERTAVFGVSAGGELALAIGLRHPEVFGVVLCASPGAGYRPPAVLGGTLPRTYLVAGTLEPFFRENALRWATALRDAGASVVMTERYGKHGDAFWRKEFPLMVTWAFGASATWYRFPSPECCLKRDAVNRSKMLERRIRRGIDTLRNAVIGHNNAGNRTGYYYPRHMVFISMEWYHQKNHYVYYVEDPIKILDILGQSW